MLSWPNPKDVDKRRRHNIPELIEEQHHSVKMHRQVVQLRAWKQTNKLEMLMQTILFKTAWLMCWRRTSWSAKSRLELCKCSCATGFFFIKKWWSGIAPTGTRAYQYQPAQAPPWLSGLVLWLDMLWMTSFRWMCDVMITRSGTRVAELGSPAGLKKQKTKTKTSCHDWSSEICCSRKKVVEPIGKTSLVLDMVDVQEHDTA